MPDLVDTQVVFRNFPLTLALRTAVYQRVLRLQKSYGRILRCTVTVGYPQHRHRVGNQVNVRLSLAFPRGQVITTHAVSPSLAHPNVAIALRDAFNAARKQLRTQVDRRRGRELASRGVGYRGLDRETRQLADQSDSTWRRASSQLRAERKLKKAR
jgi:ribosome-associated translation inhibitor RaiA